MNIFQDLGKQIRSKREKAGLTQVDLGAKIDTSRQYISAIENGRKRCSVKRLNQIAEALNSEIDIKIN